ncbi:MAG TPA: hypothetical protein VKM54_21095 [Myxococcota bacterium]|nr:hypothetical protein [Myxococcota bacterium]
MPRSLEDVLHFFLPEVEGQSSAQRRRARVSAQAIVGVPIGDSDVVRAAFVWNLAVEISRAGASATVLTPAAGDSSSLWPDPGRGPMGSELVLTFADGMADLARAAVDLAQTRAAESPGAPGVVLVRLPLAWLPKAADARPLLGRVLLFTSPDARDLLETYALVKRVVSFAPISTIGITVHGVRSVREARGAFSRLAAASERHLFRALVSYGLVVDDLHVYRSILNRHAVGLAHPQAAASRSIGEVAQLLLGDLAGEAARG